MNKLTDRELKEMSKEYFKFIYIPTKGWCGISVNFIFTVALVVGIDPQGTYSHRYCYPREKSLAALTALEEWGINLPDKEDHPSDSFWIKRKGDYPIDNKNYKK